MSYRMWAFFCLVLQVFIDLWCAKLLKKENSRCTELGAGAVFDRPE